MEWERVDLRVRTSKLKETWQRAKEVRMPSLEQQRL